MMQDGVLTKYRVMSYRTLSAGYICIKIFCSNSTRHDATWVGLRPTAALYKGRQALRSRLLRECQQELLFVFGLTESFFFFIHVVRYLLDCQSALSEIVHSFFLGHSICYLVNRYFFAYVKN